MALTPSISVCLAALVALGFIVTTPAGHRRSPRHSDHRSWTQWMERRARPDAAALAMHLARSLRAGLSLPTAFEEAARGLDPPTAALVEPLVVDLRRGAHLPELLERWPELTGSGEVRSIASVLEAGHQLGGVTARVLDEAADTIAERSRIRAHVHTQGTTARWSASVVAAAPLAGVLVASLAEPDALTFLIGGWPGRVCLVAGLVLDGVGGWWLTRIGTGVLAQW